MTPSDLPEQGDPRIEAALPEAMDFLPDHPCRQERVARAMLERVFAAVDAMPPEQGDPTDERQWVLRGQIDGLNVYESVVVVPLERAQRAEERIAWLEKREKNLSSLLAEAAGPESVLMPVNTLAGLVSRYELEALCRAAQTVLDVFSTVSFRKAQHQTLDGPMGVLRVRVGLASAAPGFLPNDPGENE